VSKRLWVAAILADLAGPRTFVWLLSRLPWPVQRILARGLGWFVYYVNPGRRHVSLVNLRRLCFLKNPRMKSAGWPGALPRPGPRPFRGGHQHVGHRSPAAPITSGSEHLTSALAPDAVPSSSRAISPRSSSSARIVAVNFRMGALYRNPNNPVIAKALRDSREETFRPPAIPSTTSRPAART